MKFYLFVCFAMLGNFVYYAHDYTQLGDMFILYNRKEA